MDIIRNWRFLKRKQESPNWWKCCENVGANSACTDGTKNTLIGDRTWTKKRVILNWDNYECSE